MKRIVIIDNDIHILEAIKLILVEEGYLITTSHSGKNVDLPTPPNLFIIDIFLSESDGFTVASTIQSNPSTKDVPILLISSYGYMGDKAKELGFTHFLEKPFAVDALLQQVKYLIH